MAEFDMPMLSNFIHQVINPLNGVVGTIDNLIDGTIGPDRREQRLRAVRAQLEHSIELIRNLSYLASTSDQLRDIKKLDVVLPQIVIEAAQFYQEPGFTRGIRIELIDKKTQYVVQGNPHLLRQVFMNLFENGIKYGIDGTEIRIISKPERDQRLLVKVSGRGIPIKGSDREKIFDLGYRTDEAKGRLASGTGLGLYICRRIMENTFNGTISVDHDANKGITTFYLRFPTHRIDGTEIPSYQRQARPK